jgi:hypothetical protein
VLATDQGEQPIFDLSAWSSIWEPTAFNEIRARIEGNPPHIQVWISGTKVMDFTDTMLRNDVAESGPLAIQVHAGSRWIEGGTVAFKNIRVRDLSAPCEDPGSGGAGAGGGAGTMGGVGASGGQGLSGGAAGFVGGGAGGDGGSAAMPTTGGVGGGQAGGGGVTAGGGGQASGGQPPTGGAGGIAAGAGGSGGTVASGGAAGDGAGGSGITPPATSDASGCACRAARRGHGGAAQLLVVLGVAARFARRQRRANERRR